MSKNKITDKKTKVLFIITKSNWGGAQKYVYELATRIDNEIFEPVVALGGKGELATKLHKAHVRVIELPSLRRDISPLQDFVSFRDILRTMRDERPDAVHLNSSKVGVFGSIAGRIAGVPQIIFTAHGWAFNEDRTILSRLIIKLFSFLTIILSDVIIAVSNAVAKDAPAWGMRQKVIVIHLPISLNETLLDKMEAREHLSKKIRGLRNENRLWIGVIAELHKNKGISYAIEAMLDSELQKNFVLVIIGEGQEEAVLRNKIIVSNLEDSVFLAGFHADAARLMHAFDIFLLPSTTEAFGYVLLEAGFASLPVVASQVGGIPEIIENEKTGLLVAPRNISAIRAALYRLIDHMEFRTKLGMTLHTKVLHDFSPQVVISRTARLYKKTP